jgi:hypothetical protein
MSQELDSEDVRNLEEFLKPVMARGAKVLSDFQSGIGLVKDEEAGTLMMVTNDLPESMVLFLWSACITAAKTIEEFSKVVAKVDKHLPGELPLADITKLDFLDPKEHLTCNILAETLEGVPSVASLCMQYLERGLESHLAVNEHSRSICLTMLNIDKEEFPMVVDKLRLLSTALDLLKVVRKVTDEPDSGGSHSE